MQPRHDINLGIEGEPDRWVHSACLLCSNGCGLDIAVKDERIVGVRGNVDHPVNSGHLGPKGRHAWVANNDPRRGTVPMIRRDKKSALEPVGWDEAMDFFIARFREAAPSESFRDLLQRMEKYGVITGASLWIEMRDTRNRIAHEYLPEELAKIYADIVGPAATELRHVLGQCSAHL